MSKITITNSVSIPYFKHLSMKSQYDFRLSLCQIRSSIVRGGSIMEIEAHSQVVWLYYTMWTCATTLRNNHMEKSNIEEGDICIDEGTSHLRRRDAVRWDQERTIQAGLDQGGGICEAQGRIIAQWCNSQQYNDGTQYLTDFNSI